MSLKNQEWVPYGKRANSVDILVKDNNGKTIESFKVYHQQGQFEKNKRIFNPKKVVKILKEKYGFDFEVEKEKDWLKKDMEW
jgi:hypothetical protein